jgi:uncharacterized phage protein (TIGR01671 family)
MDSGEWRYGSLTTYPNGRCEIVVFDNGEILEYEVDADSVGQFTGVHDKNGKEIYEGDILSVREWWNDAFGEFSHDELQVFSLEDCKGHLHQECKSVVYWDEGTMCATEKDGCSYYMSALWDKQDQRFQQPIFEVELLGNIHDNPTLITIDLGIAELPHNPENDWIGEDFDGWVIDENGNRVFMGF